MCPLKPPGGATVGSSAAGPQAKYSRMERTGKVGQCPGRSDKPGRWRVAGGGTGDHGRRDPTHQGGPWGVGTEGILRVTGYSTDSINSPRSEEQVRPHSWEFHPPDLTHADPVRSGFYQTPVGWLEDLRDTLTTLSLVFEGFEDLMDLVFGWRISGLPHLSH